MIENQNLQTLAETLAKTGLASSSTDALRMAQSIMGTEKRVATTFDAKNDELERARSMPKPSPSALAGVQRQDPPKSYKDEIDELIEKTSPERKAFHIPIRGYQIERPDMVTNIAQESEPEADIPIPSEMELEVVDMPEAEVQIEEEQHPESIEDAESEVPQVFSDIELLDDDRSLSEIMDGDAPEIYSNKVEHELEEPTMEIESDDVSDMPEYNFIHMEESNDEEPLADVESIPDAEDMPEFIINMDVVSKQKEPDQVPQSAHAQAALQPAIIHEAAKQESPEETLVNQPQPVEIQAQAPQVQVQEQKQEQPKKEIKNPIEKVDLMNYFKFG